ncbi:hypothetical protein IAU60_005481 [Kwoniella sp. DSM 27419]
MAISLPRGSPRLYLSYVAILVVAYLALGPWGLGQVPFLPEGIAAFGHVSGNTRDGGIRSTDQATKLYQKTKLTTVLNHAPGFTVVENLYWRNRSYIFVTDQPWHIPLPLSRIANEHVFPEHVDPIPHEEVIVYAIRDAPVSPEVKEANQFGRSITFEQAVEMVNEAEELPSPMLINNDDRFVNHFYHWIGETFLGAWRIWSNYAWRTGMALPDFKVVAFCKQWSRTTAPDGTDRGKIWQDHAGANEWFTKRFFPDMVIEDKALWIERAATGKLYRLPLVTIADRSGGHSGPSAGWKPWGDVLRLRVSPDWLVNLRERVLSNYAGPVDISKPSKPKIVYLERQGSGRELVPPDHGALLKQLFKIQNEGLAEVTMETFSSKIPFEDQVAKISTVDYLVSIHGNGLTHTLWMNPGATVFEIQPAECTVTDYSPLAISAGVQHYMVHETSLCVPEECPGRGCKTPNGINSPEIHLNPKVITDQIRLLIKQKSGSGQHADEEEEVAVVPDEVGDIA